MIRRLLFIAAFAFLAFGTMPSTQAQESWNDAEILIGSNLAACGEAIAAQPQDAAVWRKRAEVWYAVRAYQQAMQDTRQALKLDPNSAEAYALRAALYEQKGDTKKALRDLNRALEINPNFVRGYAQRSALYYLLEQEEASLADLKNMANVRYGEDINLYIPQMIRLRMQKNFERFAATQPTRKKFHTGFFPAHEAPFFIRGKGGLDSTLPLALPTPPEFGVGAKPPQTEAQVLRRGSLLLLSGARDKAILWFNLALQMNPQSADAYYNRGIAYASSHFYGINNHTFDDRNSPESKSEQPRFLWRENALQDLRQAVALRPSFAEAHYALGELHADRGDDAEANRSFATAVRALPRLREAQVLRVYSQKGAAGIQQLYQSEHLTNQLKPYDQKIDKEPRNADAYFARALHSRKLGIYDDLAEYIFLCGLQLSPNRTDMTMDYVKHSLRFVLAPGDQQPDRMLLDHVIKAEPNQAEAYYRRGLLALCSDPLPNPRHDFSALKNKINRDLFYQTMQQSDAAALADFSQAAALEPENRTYRRAKEAALRQKARRSQQQASPPVNEARDFSQDKSYVLYADIYDAVEKALTTKTYTPELASRMSQKVFDRVSYQHVAKRSTHRNEEPRGVYCLLKQTGERADPQNPQIVYIDMTYSLEIAYEDSNVFFPQENITFTVALDGAMGKIIDCKEYQAPRKSWLRGLLETSPSEMKTSQKTDKRSITI